MANHRQALGVRARPCTVTGIKAWDGNSCLPSSLIDGCHWLTGYVPRRSPPSFRLPFWLIPEVSRQVDHPNDLPSRDGLHKFNRLAWL
jgi:hypothetical protein